jgi:hypothetical protein
MFERMRKRGKQSRFKKLEDQEIQARRRRRRSIRKPKQVPDPFEGHEGADNSYLDKA